MLDEAIRAYVRAARRLYDAKGTLRNLQRQTQRLAAVLCDQRWTGVELTDGEAPVVHCQDRFESVDLSEWPSAERIIAVYREAHESYEAALAAWEAVPDEGRELVRARLHAWSPTRDISMR